MALAVWSAGVMLYVMLFCKYPFERKGDDRDPHKFQKILERIQRVRVVAEPLSAAGPASWMTSCSNPSMNHSPPLRHSEHVC